MNKLFTTPLFDWHESHGAKMAPFAGWNMPIQYSGIIDEHKHTRESATIFDISHMGEFLVSGEAALEALSSVLSHDLNTLKQGRCRYGFMLNKNGGILDDLIVYRKGANEFYLVVNAGNIDSDYNWLKDNLSNYSANDLGKVQIENLSNQTAKIDLQGPRALEVLENCLSESFKSLPYFAFIETNFLGTKLLISRTGYTGELGYEIYLAADKALELWEAFLKNPQVKPAGLGARDTLRLEAGLPLYGQDLDTHHSPAEAGYEGMLSSQANYIGKDNALNVKEKLVALSIEGRRSARHDDKVVLQASGEQVGRITSASFAPSLGHSIAMAYIDKKHLEQTVFNIETQKVTLEAKITKLPFYQGTARIKL